MAAGIHVVKSEAILTVQNRGSLLVDGFVCAEQSCGEMKVAETHLPAMTRIVVRAVRSERTGCHEGKLVDAITEFRGETLKAERSAGNRTCNRLSELVARST